MEIRIGKDEKSSVLLAVSVLNDQFKLKFDLEVADKFKTNRHDHIYSETGFAGYVTGGVTFKGNKIIGNLDVFDVKFSKRLAISRMQGVLHQCINISHVSDVEIIDMTSLRLALHQFLVKLLFKLRAKEIGWDIAALFLADIACLLCQLEYNSRDWENYFKTLKSLKS